jgi:arylsulfatase A-like enzyme
MPAFEDRPWMEALYKAEVAFTDRQLGRLFQVIEEQYPDALLLVTSDHGEDFWERQPQLRAHGYRLNADHGHHHFQQLSRVPGLLRLPGTDPAELRDAVELVDFFPTLLGALELEAPANQGRDLAPLLEGRQLPRPTRLSDRLLYGHSRWSVRRGPWKLVVPHSKELAPELYQLEEDPGETTDRAQQDPETVDSLLVLGHEERARRLRERGRYLSGQDVLSATYLEWNHITKLRSLGYLN